MTQSVMVNGVQHDFPDDMSEDQVLAALQTAYPLPEPPQDPALNDTPITDGLLERFGDTMDRNRTELSDRYTVLSETPYAGATDATQTTLSQGVRTVGDLGIDVLSYGWDNLPEHLKDPIKTSAEQGWEYIKDVPGIKTGIEMAISGMEAYEDWSGENPQDAEKLESTFDVASILFPRVNPIGPKVKTPFNKAALDSRRARVAKMMEPEPNTGDGVWRETGAAGGRAAYYEPKPWEIEMYEVVEDIPGIDPARTARRNAEVVLDDVGATRAELDARIINQGNPVIDMPDIKEELSVRTANLSQKEGLALVGNAEEVANRVLEEAYRILDRSDGTALGLMNARREFDDIIKKVRGDGVFDPQRESGISAASRVVRDLFNEEVMDAVPDANVHDLLNRQHQAIKAHDFLDVKARSEARNTFGRVMHELKNNSLIPTGALSAIALGGYAAGSPMIAGLALGAGGLYYGGKLIPGGINKSKQILGATINNLGKLIDKAQGTQLAKLKADRAILIEAMRNLEAQPEEPVDGS